MKKTNVIKMLLDIAIVIVFALLFNKMVFTGIAFHEVAGIVICGAFIVHKLLNWKWIKKVTSGLFNKQMPLRAKLCYVLDVILLLCIAFILFSGISISKVVFPNLQLGRAFNFERLHKSVSYLTLLFMGIHVGLHWKWIMDMFKKLVKLPANKVTPWIARVLVLGLFLFGSYNIFATNYFSMANVFAGGGKGFEMRARDKGNFPTDARRPGNGEFPSNGEFQPDTQFPEDGQFPADDQFPENEEGSNITGDTQQDGSQPQGRPAREHGKGIGKGPGGGRSDGNSPESGRFDSYGRGGNTPGSSNALSVIIKYISILSVFSTITYYAERLLIRLRRKREVK